MGNTVVQPLSVNRLEEELAGLIGAAYANHKGLAKRVRAYEDAAHALGDERHAALARLIMANLDNRNGRQAAGVRAAHAELTATTDRVVEAHAHAVLAGGLWRLGDNDSAVKHAYECHRLLGEGDPLCLRADHANVALPVLMWVAGRDSAG